MARFRFFSTGFAVVGIAVLSYVAGAAVMKYELPSSQWLTRAFDGGRQWQRNSDRDVVASHAAVAQKTRSRIDRPGKTFDGFTLYTCAADKDVGTQAFLIDMAGNEVHRWRVRYSDVWGRGGAVQWGDRSISRQGHAGRACFFGTYLYPNGDLLAVFHGDDTSYFGLAKLDKSSHVLWTRSTAMHHDVDVGEDGTIYAIQQEIVEAMPDELAAIGTPCLIDRIVLLSPDGEELCKPISVLSAIQKSHYNVLLASLEPRTKRHTPPAGSTAPLFSHSPLDWDALHTNCVRVLRSDMAASFPGFQAGQVLLSMRNLNLIAMLDVAERRVVWAARGPWLAQHDPQFLDNGRLLLFDNLGSPHGSRVLEYDVQTQAMPWCYGGDASHDLYTSERGMSQRLPNGNTFVVNSEGGEMIEVTPEKEVVWYYSLDRFITTARRYSADQLPFLDDASARP